MGKSREPDLYKPAPQPARRVLCAASRFSSVLVPRAGRARERAHLSPDRESSAVVRIPPALLVVAFLRAREWAAVQEPLRRRARADRQDAPARRLAVRDSLTFQGKEKDR